MKPSSFFRHTIVALLVAICAPAALAAGLNWSISQYDVDILIERDGSLLITEEIVADFSREAHHGIYREIPYSYRRAGTTFRLRMNVISITDETGRPYRYKTQYKNGRLTIRIGDPDFTVQRPTTYAITYRVQRALLRFDTHDELYWNATGTEWAVPIRSASCTVRLAPDVSADDIRAVSYMGPYGSSALGPAPMISDSQVRFDVDHTLPMRSGLTVVVGFPTNLVEAPDATARTMWFVRDNAIILAPVALFIALLLFWFSMGRDLGTAGSVVVQYEPPDDLSPAEVGALIDERVDDSDITASIVDLAVRGHLRIEVDEEDDDIVTLRRLDKPTDDLRGFEALLLAELFEDGDVVTIDDLEYSFYTQMPEIRRRVYSELAHAGYTTGNLGSVRTAWMVFAVLGMIACGLLSLVFIKLGIFAPASTAVAGVLCALQMPLFAYRMPRKTATGRRAVENIKGLEEYIRRATLDELDAKALRAQFERLLPFAMALRLSKRWASRFEGIYTAAPDWYRGPADSYTHTWLLVQRLDNSTRSLGRAMTTAPRSSSGGSSFGSGGSGFSGGFSGGGGGGGGGGGW